jgi:cell division protein FtsN
LRARVALTGFEVAVVQADIDGVTWHRVRLGPFARLDDLNRARARLAEAGIEGSVIRQTAAKPPGTP